MRVSTEQINIFNHYAHYYFGVDAEIWLFGSRVDDHKRGGDYDFLIETALKNANKVVSQKIALLVKLQETPEFEDEKVDIVIKRRDATFHTPIYDIAMNEGVRL